MAWLDIIKSIFMEQFTIEHEGKEYLVVGSGYKYQLQYSDSRQALLIHYPGDNLWMFKSTNEMENDPSLARELGTLIEERLAYNYFSEF